MSELFVNCREYLADSFTDKWQPHLFICQSPWLVLQFEMTVLPESLAAILSGEKTLKHFTCQNPYYNPQNVKRVIKAIFFESQFFSLSFILSGLNRLAVVDFTCPRQKLKWSLEIRVIEFHSVWFSWDCFVVYRFTFIPCCYFSFAFLTGEKYSRDTYSIQDTHCQGTS